MDYKYIEQLIERFWNAETSVEEEAILRAFFRQADVPENLQRYAALFEAFDEEGSLELTAQFDERVLQRLAAEEQAVVKAQRPTSLHILRPLFQAAAAVVVVTMIGIGAQRAAERANSSAWDYNPASFENTYDNPHQAYKVLEEGLEMFRRTAQADTAHTTAAPQPLTK